MPGHPKICPLLLGLFKVFAPISERMSHLCLWLVVLLFPRVKCVTFLTNDYTTSILKRRATLWCQRWADIKWKSKTSPVAGESWLSQSVKVLWAFDKQWLERIEALQSNINPPCLISCKTGTKWWERPGGRAQNSTSHDAFGGNHLNDWNASEVSP